jgi:hypothetical protein
MAPGRNVNEISLSGVRRSPPRLQVGRQLHLPDCSSNRLAPVRIRWRCPAHALAGDEGVGIRGRAGDAHVSVFGSPRAWHADEAELLVGRHDAGADGVARPGFLTAELALAQLPAELRHAGREYRCSYSAIRTDAELSGLKECGYTRHVTEQVGIGQRAPSARIDGPGPGTQLEVGRHDGLLGDG